MHVGMHLERKTLWAYEFTSRKSLLGCLQLFQCWLPQKPVWSNLIPGKSWNHVMKFNELRNSFEFVVYFVVFLFIRSLKKMLQYCFVAISTHFPIISGSSAMEHFQSKHLAKQCTTLSTSWMYLSSFEEFGARKAK